MKHVWYLLLFSVWTLQPAYADTRADLDTLSESGVIIGPGSERYPVHQSWTKNVTVMKHVTIWDSLIERVQSIMCSNDQNKSVLIVGEPTDAWKYIFARLALNQNNLDCENLWHVEVDISKIEAGHMYVGQVDKYWQEKILRPADNKQVTLYFNNLNGLIGIGSHSNDETGIEAELATNLTSGRIRAIAFVNKFEYQSIKMSQNAYVLSAFAEKIQLEDLAREQMEELVLVYMQTLYPHLTLNPDNLKYLLKTLEYFQPNIGEPKRSMTVLNSIVRELDKTSLTYTQYSPDPVIETVHPYEPNTKQAWEINYPQVSGLRISFKDFTLENGDSVGIYDMNSEPPVKLDTLSGKQNAFRTDFYPTNHLKLEFTSNGYLNGFGFVVDSVTGKTVTALSIEMEAIRNAIFKFVQIPKWILDRDFTPIRELETKLNEQVIGFDDGKRAIIREAKVGYIAGRTTKKPIASMLLAGPTGTGKSHLAKAFSDILDMRLITLDMTAYHTPESFERFVTIMANYLTLHPYGKYSVIPLLLLRTSGLGQHSH